MQKTMFAAWCAAAVLFSMVLAPAAMAHEGGGVTTAELGVERPGLLPTNPFYFVKEWARGIRRMFTVGEVNRAEYELRVATEKAAELKRLDEVQSDARAIARAAENYAENVERLTERLTALSKSSTNPNVDKLLDSLVARSLVHQELLGELKVKYDGAKDAIEDVQEKVDEALREVSRKLDDADTFVKRLAKAIGKRRESAVKELNAINVLDRLNADLPEEVQQKIFQLRDDLVLKFQGKASAAPIFPDALESFAGDAKEKLLVIDDVRERVLDAELKNRLSQLRDRVLKESVDEARITEEDVKRMIQYAEELAQKLAAGIVELGDKAPISVRQLLERANANIEQAKTFSAEKQFGGAFGQATAAVSAVKSAFTQLAVSAQDFGKNIEELRLKFDELQALAKKAELSREKHPKIFELFDQAEQAIVALSKLAETAVGSDKVGALLRETKALLGTIESVSREILESRTSATLLPTAKPVPAPTVVPTVQNFEECAKAGNQVLESFPRLCKTNDGRTFKEEVACVQVIQPAKDPKSGVCKEFPTPCDVPMGWVAVNVCPVSSIEQETEAKEPSAIGTAVQPAAWIVSMSDEGFFPFELKARKGDKVSWVNKGSRDHWPASDVHPTHELYPAFDAKQPIAPGASYSFVFEKVGTWKYHDHLNPGLKGVIVVSE